MLRSPRALPLRSAPAHRKVAGLSIVLLVLMLLVVTVGALAMRSARSEAERVADDGRSLTLLTDLRASVATIQIALEQAQSTADPPARAAALSVADAAMITALEQYQQASADPTVAPVMSAVAEELEAWQAAAFAARTSLDSPTPEVVESGIVSVRERYVAVSDDLDARLAELGPQLTSRADAAVQDASRALTILSIAATVGLLVGIVISRSSYRAAREQHREISSRDAARSIELTRNEQETRINRALGYSRDEVDARTVVQLALEELQPDRPAELLLADSSRAHFEVAAQTRTDQEWSGCTVPTPVDCPAIARGRTLEFDTSEHFDACPYLKNRPHGPLSAVCVPVSINGSPEGVLHSTAAPGVVTPPTDKALLELVASRAGDRIGVLRAFSRSERQAATDALTGLANRRAFEERLGELLRQRRPVAVGFGDLDHFKRLNDSHGHDAGDRALRAFARCLRNSIRPGDIAARWGGEEFVVAFPDASIDEGLLILERVRNDLARSVAAGNVPPLTVSFGVADLSDGDDVESLVTAADRALLAAKQAGRDRVVTTRSASVEGDAAPVA